MRVVFLDPKGVLVSARAAALPANAALPLRELWQRRYLPAELAIQAAFDPAAVALVNRLCEVASASQAIRSRWLSLGADVVRAKLLAEGIEERHLGDPWACEWWRLMDGPAMMRLWTKEHGRFPLLKVILDMVGHMVGHMGGLPGVHPVDGLTVQDYRLACGRLNAPDLAYGVHEVSEADLERVDETFGSVSLANEWLHGPDWRAGPTNAARLGYPVGRAGTPLPQATAAERERRRAIVWERLDAEAPPARDDPPPEPIDMDF